MKALAFILRWIAIILMLPGLAVLALCSLCEPDNAPRQPFFWW